MPCLTLLGPFGHIKYDVSYIPKLNLTLPELQNEQNDEFWMFKRFFYIICLNMSKIENITIVLVAGGRTRSKFRYSEMRKSDFFNIFHIFSSIRHVASSIADINGAVINQLQTNDSFRCIIIYAFSLFCKQQFVILWFINRSCHGAS